MCISRTCNQPTNQLLFWRPSKNGAHIIYAFKLHIYIYIHVIYRFSQSTKWCRIPFVFLISYNILYILISYIWMLITLKQLKIPGITPKLVSMVIVIFFVSSPKNTKTRWYKDITGPQCLPAAGLKLEASHLCRFLLKLSARASSPPFSSTPPPCSPETHLQKGTRDELNALPRH